MQPDIRNDFVLSEAHLNAPGVCHHDAVRGLADLKNMVMVRTVFAAERSPCCGAYQIKASCCNRRGEAGPPS